MTEYAIDPAEVRCGSQAFRSHERRDAMYKVATFLVDHFWGAPADMADALGVLLLTWNQALYRYGSFDFASLEHVLHENLTCLGEYRAREILSRPVPVFGFGHYVMATARRETRLRSFSFRCVFRRRMLSGVISTSSSRSMYSKAFSSVI